jgi:YD repeat-containing protein
MKRTVILAGVLIVCFVSCVTTQGGDKGADGGAASGEIQQAAVKPVENRRNFVRTREQVFFAAGSAGSYSAGALDEYTVSEWDPSLSNLLKETRYSASSAVLEKIEYVYQENNLISKTTSIPTAVQDPRNPSRTLEQDQVRTRVEYAYEQGRLQKETMKNKDGEIVSVYEYTYDGQGNRIGRVWKNAKGVKLAETTYAFTDGKPASVETRSPSGSKINVTAYQYDAEGNLVKQETSDAGGKITSALVSVWQNGLDVKDELSGSDNAVQLRESNIYGPDGELIQKIVENIQGKSAQVIRYEYAFK